MQERELKFRFFDPEKNLMYYDLVITASDQRPEENILGVVYSHSKRISMQYIGIPDKNNVDIYEGDIIGGWDSYANIPISGYVTFQDASFVIKNDIITHYRWMDYDIVVLGNIYENKEIWEERNN